MGDLLQTGATWLTGQRAAHMTHAVTYRRGAQSVALVATIGQTVFEQVDEYGRLQRTEARDFLLTTAALILGGTATLPLAGDRIEETVSAKTYAYEVMSPTGEPPWRYCDGYRVSLRVHTKFVGMVL